MIDTKEVAREIRQHDFCQTCQNRKFALIDIEVNLTRHARTAMKAVPHSTVWNFHQSKIRKLQSLRAEAKAGLATCQH